MEIFFKKELNNPLAWDVAGPSIVFMLGSIPLYCMLLWLYEIKVFRMEGTR